MRTLFIYHHLLVLAQSYFELKMDAPGLCPGGAPSARVIDLNYSCCSIPVRMPNSKLEIAALVSPEDYEVLRAITPVWHVSSSGYVITSRDRKVTYMHKVILNGNPGTHLNRDKFDNRRSNLQPKQHSSSRHHNRDNDEIHIKTISPLLDHVHNASQVPAESPHCSIDYENGMKYQGEIHHYRPHGFGTLTEANLCKTSIGWWIQGTFKNGLVIYQKPMPSILHEQGFAPQIQVAIMVCEKCGQREFH